MSGFERILARVGGDALRDYCSSAIEDELRNLKGKMQSCLESVEKALEVQDAIHKLHVPLSDQNVATVAAIQSEYLKFAGDLGAFIQEQRQLQAAPAASTRTRTDSVTSSVGGGDEPSVGSQQRLAKLATKIQHRLSKKHSSTTWIAKNVEDMQTIATVLASFAPDKSQRRELVLALDHFISAVLLSPATQTSDFRRLDDVLQQLESAPQELADFARNSRALVVPKLGPPSNATPPTSAGSEGRRIKRQRIDHADEFFVKVERQQQQSQPEQQHDHHDNGLHHVRVSDLPWGASQTDVESYFGVAGRVLEVRMPTMDDGSTVGVAIVRFATLDGATAALRMDGYHFQGRSIRVAMPDAQ